MQNENVSIVRMLDITIENFKNVGFGHIAFASSKTAKKQAVPKGRDIIGIYGQNGSGKTALVEALMVWRQLMKEEDIDKELCELIGVDTKLSMSFFVQDGEEKYLISQTIEMQRDAHSVIANASYSYRIWDGERWSRKRMLRPTRSKPDKQILYMLRIFAQQGLWIVTTRQLGFLNLNVGTVIDFTYHEDGTLCEEQRISLFEKNYLVGQELTMAERMIEQINVILKAVLPDIQLKLKVNEVEAQENEAKYEVVFLSMRYEKEIPFYNESGGVKRFVSILTLLIAAYNSPSVCIVVDEADSGVFEFLLGEVLDVMKNGAKGQFLFTSHNLRALEVLGKEHIIFSTANPKNRYIRFTRLQKNRNLRDEYLRTVLIGGQLENVYEDRGSLELGYAFRKAGKIYGKS